VNYQIIGGQGKRLGTRHVTAESAQARDAPPSRHTLVAQPLAIVSTAQTDRCWPPVHPKAMVSNGRPSRDIRGSISASMALRD
jgi:hypothetical protein